MSQEKTNKNKTKAPHMPTNKKCPFCDAVLEVYDVNITEHMNFIFKLVCNRCKMTAVKYTNSSLKAEEINGTIFFGNTPNEPNINNKK